MKILMATMGLDIGGAETHIVELSKELVHQGHQVVIVSNGGVYVPEIAAAGIRHYDSPHAPAQRGKHAPLPVHSAGRDPAGTA